MSEPSEKTTNDNQPHGGDRWSEMFPGANPENLEKLKAKFTDPSALADSYVNLESHLGAPEDQLMRLPKPEDQEGWDAVYERLGRPQTPDEYQFDAEQLGMSDEQASALRQKAHEAGLTPKQVETVLEAQRQSGEKFSEAQKEAAENTDTLLRKEWGEDYKSRKEAAMRTAEDLMGDDFEAAKGTLEATPGLMRAFDLAASAASEGGAPGNRPGTSPTQVDAEAMVKELIAKKKAPGISASEKRALDNRINNILKAKHGEA